MVIFEVEEKEVVKGDCKAAEAKSGVKMAVIYLRAPLIATRTALPLAWVISRVVLRG